MHWQKMDDEYLQSFSFVAFDTETTGLWAPINKIVEVGAIKFRLGESKSERFAVLVNPECKIPIETVQIHGITDTMVAKAETIGPVLKEFFEFCGDDSVLIAHNAMFDISFVSCEADRVDLPTIDNPILDTVNIFRQYSPGLESYALLSLAREYKISRDQSHRAADDAALVWKLFSQVSEQFPFIKTNSEFRREFTFYKFSDWDSETPELPDEFSDLTKAIDEELPIEIVYASEGRRPEARTIRPHRVHQLKSRLYLSAYCEKAHAERTFRLDRIRSFRLIK